MLAGVWNLRQLLYRHAIVDNLILDQKTHVKKPPYGCSKVYGQFYLFVRTEAFTNIDFLYPEIEDNRMAAQDKDISD